MDSITHIKFLVHWNFGPTVMQQIYLDMVININFFPS